MGGLSALIARRQRAAHYYGDRCKPGDNDYGLRPACYFSK